MKIDFSPRLQMGIGENPVGGALSSVAGSTPYGAIAQAGLGLIQGIGGWIQQHKATKQLEKMQSPTYTQNKSIMDYYNTSLQRYGINPYQSAQYQNTVNQVNRNQSSLLNNLKGRGGSVANVGKIAALGNDAAIKAGITAENEQSQRFGELRNATAMKTTEDQRAFEINQQQPFERKYNLKAMKAGGGTNVFNAGVTNLGQAASTYDQYKMIDKLYGK